MEAPKNNLVNDVNGVDAQHDPASGRGEGEVSPTVIKRIPRQKGGRESEWKVAAWNVRGMNDECKKEEVRNVCEEERLDVCGLCETKVKGMCEWEWGSGWGVGSGVKEGRGREGVAIVVSERARKCVREYGCVSSRVVWVKMKVGIERWFVVCAYAPTNDCKKEDKESFWVSVEECMTRCKSNERVFLIGDMNGKVGVGEDDEVVGKWGVPGVNENGEWLKRVCAGKGMFVANTCFKHRDAHRYSWWRDGDERVRSLIDYVCVDERLKGRILDARVRRGRAFGMSDHGVVVARVRMCGRWKKRRIDGQRVKG